MRIVPAVALLFASCIRPSLPAPASLDGRPPMSVALSVTEQGVPPVVDSILAVALRDRGLIVGRAGDSVEYLIIAVAECVPIVQGHRKCADSTQLAIGLWSAAPQSARGESEYIPTGVRSERSELVRLASGSVVSWLERLVDSVDRMCFDRERARRGASARSDSTTLLGQDEGGWRCRSPVGRVRAP